MTTNNTSEETRMFNEQTSEETQRIENDDEQTRMAGSVNEDESTHINPAAPASRKAMSVSPWAARLGFGVGGAALGFGAGYAVSANASTADTSVTGLAPAATPEDEMTPEEKADSVLPDRERTVIDDPNNLPASTVNEVKATDEPLAVEPVESELSYAHTNGSAHAAAQTATVAGNNDNHIIGENPVGNTPTEQPVEVVLDETPATETATETTAAEAATVPVDIESAETAEGTIPDQSDIILTNEHGVRYAHVNDDMSFGEAFTAAREQVGTPGVFEWHGNTYGTYYAEEWNEMSVEDRSEFIHNVDFPEDLNRDAPIEDEVPVVEVHEVVSSINSDGEVMNAAHVTIDGTDTYMIDIDGNKILDVAVVDIDGNQEYTEGVDAVIPIDDQNITMDHVMNQMIPGSVPVEEPAMEPTMDPAMDPAAEMPVEDDMAMNDFESNTMPDF